MKGKKSRMLLSAVLVICMVFGMAGTAFAGTNYGRPVNYVSLGDSMTNGYGLTGYDNNGFKTYGQESYANLFADWLVSEGYAEGSVAHSQLAMSAMRAEDLHFILEFPVDDAAAISVAEGEWNEAAWNSTFPVGDYYTWDEFTTGRFTKNGCGGTNETAKTYQNAIANADIISMGVGNANFGVFLLGRITNALGILGGNAEKDAWIDYERTLAECDAETKAQVLALKAELETLLYEQLKGAELDAENEAKIQAAVNAMTYGATSYVLNYAGALERILELNPDAEIILVGIMNTMAGMDLNFNFGDEAYTIPMAAVLDVLVEPVNAYIATLPTVMKAMGNGMYDEATIYYAEAPEVDVIVSNFGDLIKLPKEESVVRSRFVTEIVGEACNHSVKHADLSKCSNTGMVWAMVAPIFNGILGSQGFEIVPITLTDIEDYEAEKLNNPNKILSVAIYKAFEDAIVAASTTEDIDLSSFLTLANGLDSVFNVLDLDFDFEAIEAEVIKRVTDAGTEAVKKYVEEHLDAFAAFCDGDPAVMAAEESAIVFYCANQEPAVDPTKLVEHFAEKYAAYYTATVIGETVGPALTTALTSNDTLMGLLHLFGRMLIGDGLGAHPSAEGHLELYNAVTEAYAGDHTTDKAVAEKATVALEALIAALEQYGPDIAAGIYDYAEDNGYIAQLEAALEELETAAQEQLAYVEAEVIPEIEAAIAEAEAALNAAYEQLQGQMAEIQTVIEQLEAEIQALEEELAVAYEELAELYAQLEAAAEEAKPAIQAAIDTTNAVIEGILDAIEEIELVKEALDESIAVLEAKMAEVQEMLATLKENAEALGEELYALGEAAAAAAQAAADLAAALAAGAQEGIEEAYAQLEAAYNALAEKISEIDILGDAIDALLSEAENMNGILNSALEELAAVAEDAFNTAIAELEKLAAEGFAYAEEALAALQAGGLAALEELKQVAQETAAELYPILMEKLAELDSEVAALAAEAEAAFKAAYIGAITGEFAIDCESKIVSIGDESALNAEASYGKLLAAELSTMNGLDAELEHIQLGQAGIMAEDLLDIVKANAETIADADMVTVSMDNNDFIIEKVMAAALHGAEAEFDWAKYVTEEGVPYVEAALAELEAYLAEEAGLGVLEVPGMEIQIDMLKTAMVAVESFAYSYVDYAWNYAQVLNAVHAINPEAQVVLVGMFNPLKDMVIADVEIGAVLDQVVALSDLYGLGYAMIVPNTTFVAVPNVDIVFDATPEDFAHLGPIAEIMYYGELIKAMERGGLLASAEGHEYIKDQIMAAFAGNICAGQHVPGEWVEVSFVNGILKEALHCVVCGVQIDERTTDLNPPVVPPVISGGFFVPQKPVIEASEGVKVELNADGTKATFTVEEGYILMDVVLNGESLGTDITEVTGLKTGDVLKITAMSEADFAAMVKDTQLVARSKMSKAKGKDAVKVYWYEKVGEEKIYDLDFDGYQVFRSVKRYSGFGKKPIFTTAREAYWNTDIEEGVKYFYKVRGFVEVEGKKYYTDWSLKAWRTVEL